MNYFKFFFQALFIIQILFLDSCQSTFNQSRTFSSKPKKDTNKKTSLVLKEAKSYLGTPYKYAGIDRDGIDCSGLIYITHKKIGIDLPRSSGEQSNFGIFIDINDVTPGDLLFFNTSGSGISHSGMVEEIKNNEIFFIHASTSKGVIISSLEETYWKSRYVSARRIP